MITKLDHVNLRTRDLDRMVRWYEGILDLRVGPRPNFAFDGAWLYAGGDPIIHCVADDTLDDTRPESLTLEHFGLRATDYPAFMVRLKSNEISFYEAKVSSGTTEFRQVNIHDPDGNHIHVDFPLDDTE